MRNCARMGSLFSTSPGSYYTILQSSLLQLAEQRRTSNLVFGGETYRFEKRPSFKSDNGLHLINTLRFADFLHPYAQTHITTGIDTDLSWAYLDSADSVSGDLPFSFFAAIPAVTMLTTSSTASWSNPLIYFSVIARDECPKALDMLYRSASP
jgi:hypothetical protein